MSDWVRPLFRTSGASREWHVARSKGLTTVTYCEENIKGPLEIASEDKAEREGRCSKCAIRVATPQGMAPLKAMGAAPSALAADPRVKVSGPARDTQRREPRLQAPQAAVKQAAAKNAIKKSASRKASSKAAVAKRTVRRSRRGRA